MSLVPTVSYTHLNSKKEDEYSANYFMNNFLCCSQISDSRTLTKKFINAVEIWTRSNITEDAGKAEKVRSTDKEEDVYKRQI